MKKYLRKILLFTTPFYLLHIANYIFYNDNNGDLSRVGLFYFNNNPRNIIDDQYENEIYYSTIVDLDGKTPRKFDVIAIGDSFSGQNNLSYLNFIAKQGYNVLQVDRKFVNDNPIQRLVTLLNSDFFDIYNTEYVILQNVQRAFNIGHDIDFDSEVDIRKAILKQTKNINITKKNNSSFFLSSTIIIPLTNIMYIFTEKPKHSKVYKIKVDNKQLFSNKIDNILIYEDDIKRIISKNSEQEMEKSVSIINKLHSMLKEKNIKLINIISPDKYEIYYHDIHDNNKKESKFYENYNKMYKEYLDIDAYTLLLDAKNDYKNIYYYDDSHWSPIGAKVVAEEVIRYIK